MKKANILTVSLRIAIIAALFVGAFYINSALTGIAGTILACVLIAAAAAIVVNLAVWGFKWLKNERVSELGLHIVRFAIILSAVALSIFVMLSKDYTKQHSLTNETELCQVVLAGEVYMQNHIGEATTFSSSELNSLHNDLKGLLIANESNAERISNLYMFHDVTDTAINTPPYYPLEGSDNILAASSNESVSEWLSADVINEVSRSGEVRTTTRTIAGSKYLTAFAPVYSTSGMAVGVLEICAPQPAAISVFGFATLELMLTVAALLILFSCAFYGVIQFIDIALRPKRYDPTRILPCGRESIRPVSFFISAATVIQLPVLLLSPASEAVTAQLSLPLGLAALIPFIVYLLGANLGLVLGRFPKNTLKVLPIAGGLTFAVVCMILKTAKLSAFAGAAAPYIDLALILFTALGHGVAFRVASRYQLHSDAQYGRDKYAYLSPAFGAIAGIIFGALIFDELSFTANNIIFILLTAVAAAVCFTMLRDIEFTADDGMNGKNPLVTFRGALMVVIAVGAACCFEWVYISLHLAANGISATAISCCAVAPIAAFCFGNRLSLKTRNSQRLALFISGLLTAGAFVVMAVSQSLNMTVVSCALITLSVIFLSSAIYSVLQPAEINRCLRILRVLGYIAVILSFIMAVNLTGSFYFYIAAAVAAAFALIFILFSRFPRRIEDIELIPALAAHEDDDIPVVANEDAFILASVSDEPETGYAEEPVAEIEEEPVFAVYEDEVEEVVIIDTPEDTTEEAEEEIVEEITEEETEQDDSSCEDPSAEDSTEDDTSSEESSDESSEAVPNEGDTDSSEEDSWMPMPNYEDSAEAEESAAQDTAEETEQETESEPSSDTDESGEESVIAL